MTNLVPVVAGMTKRDIERDANSILQRYFPDRLKTPGRLDVLEFWELLEDEFGLQPGVEDLSDGVEGMTWPDGRVMVSEETYRNATEHHGRARFTICHEAYHGIKHRTQIRGRLVDAGDLTLFRRSEIPTANDPEWQANVFAAAILMPALMVREVIREATKQKEVEDMMWYFGVTKTAARIRVSVLRRTGFIKARR